MEGVWVGGKMRLLKKIIGNMVDITNQSILRYQLKGVTYMAQLCNRPVKCWDNSTRHCVRPSGHEKGCNPFSDSLPQESAEVKRTPILSLLDKAYKAAGLAKNAA